jgi:hypothetical protein
LDRTLDERRNLVAKSHSAERPACIRRSPNIPERGFVHLVTKQRAIPGLPRASVRAEGVVLVVSRDQGIEQAKRIGAMTRPLVVGRP